MGPFLESPSSVTLRVRIKIKSVFRSKSKEKVKFLAEKPVHFVLFTDSFITLFAKLSKPRTSKETT